MNYRYAEINIEDINSWDDLVVSNGIHVINNVVNISADEYSTLVKNSFEESGADKILNLKFIPDSRINGHYKLVHYFAISKDGKSNEVYLKLIDQSGSENINQFSTDTFKDESFSNPGFD